MQINDFLEKIKQQPEQIEFSDVIALIEKNYQFSDTQFQNGLQLNLAGQNAGSCKIFSFANLHHLDALQTLACFGRYYRQDVLNHPKASDHQNIRQFMISGWPGVQFSGQALTKK